jgi:CubicO group peptidase (beta-lactamase class C family)
MRLGPAVLCLAAVLLGGCAGAATTQPVATPAPFVRAPIQNGIYPGISIAVGGPAGLVTAQADGYADVAHHIAMTTQTPLRLASVSKSVTAVAVMLLDQKGSISIDKPVSTYVPRYKYGSQMTVRELLDHTSGIPGRAHGDPILHGNGAISTDEFFARANATPLYGPPGKTFDYSNENYYLLATIVQNVSGMKFGAFLQKYLFAPAGMTSTYSDDGRTNPQLALGYVHRLKTDPLLQCPAPDPSNVFGAGGLIGTPSDMVRLDMALLDGKILDAKHLAEMFKPSVAVGNGHYALGWFVYPDGTILHEGDFTIASAINAIFPDHTVVAEAANGAELGPDFDRPYFARQLQNAYGSVPIALGKPHPASLLELIAPFKTCAELDRNLFGK